MTKKNLQVLQEQREGYLQIYKSTKLLKKLGRNSIVIVVKN